TLPIRSCAIRRGSTGSTPSTRTSASIRRCVALIATIGAHAAVHLRASRSVVLAFSAIRRLIAAFQLLNDESELLLQNLDTLLHASIGLETADCLHVEVEFLRLRAVVEWLTFLRWIFQLRVLAERPLLDRILLIPIVE